MSMYHDVSRAKIRHMSKMRDLAFGSYLPGGPSDSPGPANWKLSSPGASGKTVKFGGPPPPALVLVSGDKY